MHVLLVVNVNENAMANFHVQHALDMAMSANTTQAATTIAMQHTPAILTNGNHRQLTWKTLHHKQRILKGKQFQSELFGLTSLKIAHNRTVSWCRPSPDILVDTPRLLFPDG
jgi:hypothetical protein